MAIAAATAAEEMAAAFQSTTTATTTTAEPTIANPMTPPPLSPFTTTTTDAVNAVDVIPGVASLKRSAEEANLDDEMVPQEAGGVVAPIMGRATKKKALSTTTTKTSTTTTDATPKKPRKKPGRRPRKSITQTQPGLLVVGPNGTTTTHTMNRRDQQWEHHYEQLVKYKKDHNGDCNVQQQAGKYKKLVTWVTRVRTHFREIIHETISRQNKNNDASASSSDGGDDKDNNDNTDDSSKNDGKEQNQDTNKSDETNHQKVHEESNKDGDTKKAAISDKPEDEKDDDDDDDKEKKRSLEIDDNEAEKTTIDPKMVEVTIQRLHGTDPLEAYRLRRLFDLGLRFEEPKNKRIVRKQEHMIKKQYKDEAEEWEERFQELIVFKEKFGHTNVPSYPKSLLRNWICLQRSRYQQLKDGKPHEHFTRERMERLTQLGVEWSAPRRLPFDQTLSKWLEFRTKHGRDPSHITEAGGLIQWIRKVRRRKKLMDAGEKTPLTQEQADRLTKWGFVWEGGEDGASTAVGDDSSSNNQKKSSKVPTPQKQAPKKPWEERYALLVAFHKKHGHCLVPTTYPELGPWVLRQRKLYRFMQQGKPTPMTAERMAKLEEIGFVFRARRNIKGGEIAVHIPTPKQGPKQQDDSSSGGGAAAARREDYGEEDEEEVDDDDTSSEEEDDNHGLSSRFQQQYRPQRQQHRQQQRHPQGRPAAFGGVQPSNNVLQHQFSHPWDRFNA